MTRGILIGWGLLLALGVLILLAVLIGVVIGRGSSVKTPAGGVTVNEPASTVTIRVSGTRGIQYQGSIGTSETGQKSIDGTLGSEPDNYELPLNTSPLSTDNVTATVGKRPRPAGGFQPGTLRLQLLVDGRVVKEQESSSETATVTLNYDPAP